MSESHDSVSIKKEHENAVDCYSQNPGCLGLQGRTKTKTLGIINALYNNNNNNDNRIRTIQNLVF